MGVLKDMVRFQNIYVNLKTVPLSTPGVDIPPLKIQDARQITLSEYIPSSKGYITAHRIQDYRRKSNTMILLPEVSILFDKILEGSYYGNELSTIGCN